MSHHIRPYAHTRAAAGASGSSNATAPALVAANHTYSATAGKLLSVRAPGVLANATNPGGGGLRVANHTQPSGGGGGAGLVIAGNGSLTYTPQPGSFGAATFTYTITDGNRSATSAGCINIGACAARRGARAAGASALSSMRMPPAGTAQSAPPLAPPPPPRARLQASTHQSRWL